MIDCWSDLIEVFGDTTHLVTCIDESWIMRVERLIHKVRSNCNEQQTSWWSCHQIHRFLIQSVRLIQLLNPPRTQFYVTLFLNCEIYTWGSCELKRQCRNISRIKTDEGGGGYHSSAQDGI